MPLCAAGGLWGRLLLGAQLRPHGSAAAQLVGGPVPKEVPVKKKKGLLQKSVESRLSTALFVSEDFKLEKTITR